jgi:parallel beta-helix repeat protein
MKENRKTWLIVSLFLLVAGALEAADVNNSGFESEQDGLMPIGVSTSVRSTWAMPDNWAWRKLGNTNGHGIHSDDSSVGWSSHADWSLYAFISTGSHSVGDYIEFYQDVDLTGWDELSFDIYRKGSQHVRSYVAIDSQKLWTYELFQRAILVGETIDVSGFSGTHEIRLGVEMTMPTGLEKARGWTYFDNLTLSSGGAMMALFGTEVMSASSEPKVIYVDADRPGGGGTSWADAYKYLQDALADGNTSAKPVEIRVAQGTYKPDEGAGVTDGDREATFGLINGVTAKGGYAGDGEPDPNARDITNYETILSGDLDGNDVQVPPSALLSEPTRAENSYHVVTGSGTDANAVLDGFTITAGNANETVSPNKYGGGMVAWTSSLTLSNCTFNNNSAYNLGGGIGAGGITITNCTFSDNYAVTGGGMYGSGTTLTDCIFSNNTAYAGGGVYCNEMILTNCTFNNNTANGGGGGMEVYNADPVLTNCTFSGNSTTTDGGAIYLRRGDMILNSCKLRGNSAGQNGGAIWLSSGHPTLAATNCTFSGNWAGNNGGAVYFGDTYSTLTNCTLSGNSAANYGGGICTYIRSYPIVTNCILWGNTAAEGPQIALTNTHAGYITLLYINYCDVQGGEVDVYRIEPAALLDWGSGNINEDPLFADADGPDNTVGTEDDNLRLTNGSPCIDAADNTLAGTVPIDTNDLNEDGFADVATAFPSDLDGRPRIVDGDCNDTDIVDMGAYEFLRSDIALTLRAMEMLTPMI